MLDIKWYYVSEIALDIGKQKIILIEEQTISTFWTKFKFLKM